jgi:protein-S-isoprenylcysteine O-methyltransferase Ste14
MAVIQIGKFRLAGWRASVVLFCFGILLASWFVYHPLRINPPVLLSILGFLAFNAYWGAAAKNSSPTQQSETPQSRRVHQYLLSAALILVFIPIPGLQLRFLPDTNTVIATGLTIEAICGALGVWARRHLGAQWSGEITIKVDHQLIRSGPYRILRHPIYTAWLGMYIGPAIVSGEWHSLLGAAMAIVAYARKIRIEEATLQQNFGDEYAAYKRRTWALIPFVY